MTAPDKIWARERHNVSGWHDATSNRLTAELANDANSANPFAKYISFTLHQSALAAKDAEIARLQAAANDFALKWATVCDERDSLQARLDAVDRQRERQTQQNTLDEIFASRGTE